MYSLFISVTCTGKGILDILNETDGSTDDELLEYAMTLVNKVNNNTNNYNVIVNKQALLSNPIRPQHRSVYDSYVVVRPTETFCGPWGK